MSPVQTRSGASTQNLRSSRFGETGRLWALFVVALNLRLPRAQRSCAFISFRTRSLHLLSPAALFPTVAPHTPRRFRLYPVVQLLTRNPQGPGYRKGRLPAADQSNCFLLEFQRVLSPNRSSHAQTLQSRSYTISLGRRSSGARSPCSPM